MIELSGIIESGNYAFAGHPTRPSSPSEISLTGDTEIRGGNFVLAHITTNGFKLTLTGGNCRGLRTRINPTDAWAKQDGFVWRHKAPLDLAIQIRKTIKDSGGVDAVEAWDFAVSVILANPTIDQLAWEAEQTAWGAKTGAYINRDGKVNLLLPSSLLTRLIDMFFPGGTFVDVRNAIIAHDADAWAGALTQIIEAWD